MQTEMSQKRRLERINFAFQQSENPPQKYELVQFFIFFNKSVWKKKVWKAKKPVHLSPSFVKKYCSICKIKTYRKLRWVFVIFLCLKKLDSTHLKQDFFIGSL